MEYIAKIAELNDKFRKYHEGHGKVVLTKHVFVLGRQFQEEALKKLQTCDDFDSEFPENEHDFGHFICQNIIVCWRIDCYDLEQELSSEDPTGIEQRLRFHGFAVEVVRVRARLKKGGPRHTIFLAHKDASVPDYS